MRLRETLINAALKLLESQKQEPSLRSVAREAGVSAMAPYRHFSDKAGLLAAVASQGFVMLRNALLDADKLSDPRHALVAQGLAFVTFARANPALFRLMYSHQYGHAEVEVVRETYEILARRCAGILPSRAVAATLACRALVQGLATIELNGRLAPATADDVTVAVQFLVAGLSSGIL